MHLMWQDMFHLDLPLLEKIVRPILIYFFLIALLRLAGKRELAQINTFDLVVLLLLSNTVQNAIIGNDNSVTGGVVGAIALVATNILVVRFMVGHPLLSRIVEGDTDILIEKGEINQKKLEAEGITLHELEAAAHRQGFASLAAIETATLEASGAICFLGKEPTEESIRHQELVVRLEQISRELAELKGRTSG